jgi:hypothetical protein
MRDPAIVAALFGFCLSTTFLAAWIYRAVDNAKAVLAIWLVLYCLAPLGVDLVRHGMSERSGRVMATAATLSPVGLIVEAATEPRAKLKVGAAFNALVPLLPIALYIRSGRRRVKATV